MKVRYNANITFQISTEVESFEDLNADFSMADQIAQFVCDNFTDDDTVVTYEINNSQINIKID